MIIYLCFSNTWFRTLFHRLQNALKLLRVQTITRSMFGSAYTGSLVDKTSFRIDMESEEVVSCPSCSISCLFKLNMGKIGKVTGQTLEKYNDVFITGGVEMVRIFKLNF